MRRSRSELPNHFSRAASSAAQHFSILKETGEILSGNLRKAKPYDILSRVRRIQRPKLSLTELEVLKLIKDETEHLLTLKEQQEKTKQLQASKSPLFSTQTREAYYRTKVRTTQANKDKIPPCGWYDVNYALLDR
jgi:hypothetical protein